MSKTRRDFLGQTLVVGGAAAAASFGMHVAPLHAAPLRAQTKKRILILGGTGFIGPKTVEAALARGHSVSVFNRGRTEKRIPFEFKDVEHLYGNRDPLLPADDERGPDGKLLRPDASPKGLEQLKGKTWDAVIDNSGYYPRLVKASAELLAPNAKQYIFVSSISAYAANRDVGADETAALATLADPSVETMGANSEFYGGLKVLCEQAAEAAFPGRTAIVRPGYIVGPGDPTDRFTYWPVRVERGGEMLAPGSPDDALQWIDSRDLAQWLVRLVENGTTGAFNAVGPGQRARWGDVLAACTGAVKKPAQLVWVPSEWLMTNGMGGDEAFPIWIAPMGDYAGFHTWKNERAQKAGLTFRPIAETVKETLAWYPTEIARRERVTKQMIDDAAAKGLPAPRVGDPRALRAGPSAEREKELLEKWKAAAK